MMSNDIEHKHWHWGLTTQLILAKISNITTLDFDPWLAAVEIIPLEALFNLPSIQLELWITRSIDDSKL